MLVKGGPGFLIATMATTSSGIEFLDFLQSSITSFDAAMSFESTGMEYLLQIVALHPIQEILVTDLVLGCDTTYPLDHKQVTVLQAMQITWGWGSGVHGDPDVGISNSSSGGNGKWGEAIH